MLDSFKLFIELFFSREIKSLFSEMTRAIENKIPVFDQDDQNYYRHIYENLPESWREDEAKMIAALRAAIYYRYGSPEMNGFLHKNEKDEDYITLLFKIGRGGSIKSPPIGKVPFFGKKLQDKIDHYGYVADSPFFGYTQGSSNDLGKKAKSYLDFFKNQEEVGNRDAYMSPHDDRARKGASTEKIQDLEERSKKGKQKKTWKSLSDTENRSSKPVPYDEGDKQFISSVEQSFKNNYIYLSEGAEREKFINMLPTVKQIALGMRYSDHFVTMEDKSDKSSKFIPTDLGKDNITLQLRASKMDLKLPNVHLGINNLLRKFEEYRLSRNFVLFPIIPYPEQEQQWRTIMVPALYRMQDFMDKGYHSPRTGSNKDIEIIKNPKLYEQMKQDHDLWFNNMGRPIMGKPPITDDELPWRNKDGFIMESPNIGKNDMMPWDELIKKDAEIGANSAIKYLPNVIRSQNFLPFTIKHKEDIVAEAWKTLTAERTGSEGYREEAKRIHWAANAAGRYIRKELAKLDKALGHTGEEDKIDLPAGEEMVIPMGYIAEPDRPQEEDQPRVAAKRLPLPDEETAPIDKQAPLVKPKEVKTMKWLRLSDSKKREVMARWATMTPQEKQEYL